MRGWKTLGTAAGAVMATLSAAAPAAAEGARITLFNQGAALVTEQRNLTLKAGEQTVTWPGLPGSLVSGTLMLAGDGVSLVGYRDSRDLMRPDALLQRLVGETVTLRRDDGQGGDIERQALLMSADRGAPLVRLDGRIEVLDARSPWRIAAQWPDTLPQDPAVALDLRAKAAGARDLALTYQAGGLGWNAEYVARYDDDERRLTLQANALLRNHSGGDWNDAELVLVAGELNRESGSVPMAAMARMEAADSAAKVSPESAFEYYRYRMPDPVTLRSGETRSLALMDEVALEVEREYRIEGGWQRIGDAQRANAVVRLSFDNKLDRPLPAGTVRVYDGNDPPQLLGEDAIGHTPEDAGAALTLGRAFDITAVRAVEEEVRDGAARESERRIIVSNAKDEPVKVRIVESMPGDWEVISQNLPHEKLDAHRAVWVVGVPANGKARLSYRVRWR